MKAEEIRELSDQELISNLRDFRREHLNLRIQARTGQIENTARLNTLRKDIARILTEQTRRSQAPAR